MKKQNEPKDTEALNRAVQLYNLACQSNAHPRFVAMLDRRVSELTTPVKINKAAEAKAPA